MYRIIIPASETLGEGISRPGNRISVAESCSASSGSPVMAAQSASRHTAPRMGGGLICAAFMRGECQSRLSVRHYINADAHCGEIGRASCRERVCQDV